MIAIAVFLVTLVVGGLYYSHSKTTDTNAVANDLTQKILSKLETPQDFTSNPKHFTSKSLGITFQYPNDWQVTDATNLNHTVLCWGSQFNENVQISSTPANGEDLSTFIGQTPDFLKRTYPSITNIQVTVPPAIANLPTDKITYSYTKDQNTLAVEEQYFIKDGTIYNVHYTVDASQFDHVHGALDLILKTLVVP